MAESEFVWDGRGNRGDKARLSVVPAKAATDPRLGKLHLKILLFIGRFDARKGWCRVSQTSLARKWAVTRQSVNKAFGELAEWGYFAKQNQQRTGESFCLYRLLFNSEENVRTSNSAIGEGVSGKPDTGVERTDTRVSSNKDTLISRIGDIESEVDTSSDPSSGKPNEKEGLPFTPTMIKQIELMGLDPRKLIKRYQYEELKKARRGLRPIEDPNAYILQMACDQVAKDLGMSCDEARKLLAADVQSRTAALIAASASNLKPKSRLRASPELVRKINGK